MTRPALSSVLFSALLISTLDALAEPPHSLNWENYYLGVGYAIAYAPDDALSIQSANGTTGMAELDYDLGFRTTSMSLGYRLGEHWRLELEGAYRRNELEIIEFDDARGILNTGVEDSVEAISGLANLYYEFSPALAFRPYVGAGIGFASTQYETSFSRPGFDFKDNTPLFDEKDTTFAWQLIAGASVGLTPRIRLAAEYRYWRTGELSFSAITTPGGAQETYKTRHALHMAGLHLQYFPGARAESAQTRRRLMGDSSSKHSNHYIAARFGAVAAEDSDLDFQTSDVSADNNFDAFDLGPIGSLAIGTSIPSWSKSWPIRVELEATRFSNEADLVDFGRLVGEYRLKGDAKVDAVAVNLLIDRPQQTNRWGLAPFLGLGLGYAKVDYDISLRANHAGPGSTELGARARQGAAPGNPPGEGPNPESPFIDDSDSGLMIQALLGFSVRLSERLDASMSYRYWLLPDLEVDAADGVSQQTKHSAHAILLGLRYRGWGR